MMILRELVVACRRLVRQPGYTALAVSVLGVGLGLMLFLFCLVDGLVLQPLPAPHADHLLTIGYAHADGAGIGIMSHADFEQLKPGLADFESSGFYAERSFDVAGVDGAHRYVGTLVSGHMLSMLGVHPLLGRSFTAADAHPGAALTVMLGETVWRHQFHGDKHIVGRAIRVDGDWATVIGVLPHDFSFPYVSQVWVPSRLTADAGDDTDVVVRSPLTMSLSAARANLAAAAHTAGSALRGQRAGRTLTMRPLASRFVDPSIRTYAWLMFAAGALVLLLACVNVANLQWVQTLNRGRELALRSALGAGSGQLLRAQLVESLILSVAAMLFALLCVALGSRWFTGLLTAHSSAPPYYVHFGIDAHVLVAAALAALLTTGVSGILPALGASRRSASTTLREGSAGSQGIGFMRVTRTLVVIEIALTVVLLVGAGTFVRGLQRVLAAPTHMGTDPAHVALAQLTLPPRRYADDASRSHYARNLVARLQRDPSVLTASVGNTIPQARLGTHEFVAALGQPRPVQGWQRVQMGAVDTHFASVYGVRLLAGRGLKPTDDAAHAPVAVIDRNLARQLWPGQRAIGQTVSLHPEDPHPLHLDVVGVIAPVALDGMFESKLPGVLVPFAQHVRQSMVVAVHTRGAAKAYLPHLGQVLRGVDSSVPYGVETQARAIATSRLRFTVLIEVFGVVGTIALLLAAAGLYGVMAFSVAQRTREIGIRRAIGAGHGAIIVQVGRQLVIQLGLGLILGLVMAWPWSRLLANPIMHTRGGDLAVFASVVGMVMIIAVVSACVPLRRALSVDPVVALKQE